MEEIKRDELMEEAVETTEQVAEEVVEAAPAAEEAVETAADKAIETEEVAAETDEAAADEAVEDEADGIKIEITIEKDAPEGENAEAEKKDSKKRFFKKTENGFEVDTSRIESSFKSLGEQIAAAFNSASQAINVARESAQQKANQKKKADRLAKMLPYMKEEEIHEIAEAVINGDETFKDVELAALLPVMSEADCRVLFEKSLAANDEAPGTDDYYLLCVPYVGEEALTQLVDRYVEGHYQDIKMDDVYPYLASKDVKRIFYFEMKKD